MTYHVPVLLKEVLSYLVLKADGSYLDCTLGGGGHTKAILAQISTDGKLLSIDRDEDAINENQHLATSHTNFSMRRTPFSELLSLREIEFGLKFDGILLDLGVSSYQIDTAHRGFSYMTDGELDMRMDNSKKNSAKEIINNYSAEELANIFWQYGEEKLSRHLAAVICRQREKNPIQTTGELKMLIEGSVHHSQRMKSTARIFQALRIEVNQELEELKSFLNFSLDILNPQGRVGVISYHSLEDKIVKSFINELSISCVCPPGLPRCICNSQPKIKKISNSAIKASKEELALNSRSRSALFRVYEKI